MRRPGVGVARRQGFRGIGGGAPAPAFDPLADPDIAGLWAAVDATDDGTTLTVPNRVTAGPSFTATGVGRQTIDAAYIDGRHPAIVMAGSTVAFAAAGNMLDTATESTLLILRRATSKSGAANFYSYGATYQQLSSLWANSGTQTDRVSASGSRRSESIPGIILTSYAQVDVARSSIPLDTGHYALDGREVGVNSGACLDTANTFGSGSLRLSGPTPFPGGLGAWALVKRRLTDAEILVWSDYLRALVGVTTIDFVWLGDSITANTPSYRQTIQTLYDARVDNNRFYRCLGRTGQGTTWAENWTEAGAGLTFATLTSTLATQSLGVYWFPRVVPILLGTNDIQNGVSAAQMKLDAAALIDLVAARCPTAKVVMLTCIARSDGNQPTVVTWNTTHLPTVVADAVARGVDCILDTTPSDTTVSTSDGVHPDAAGAAALGTALEPRTRVWAGIT